jgi:intracellular septation protein
MAASRKLTSLQKLLIDLGPLGVFFAANGLKDIYWATGAFMAAFLVAMGVSYAIARRFEPMLLFTGFFVIVFGGLTLYLHDATFIKLKPTLLYGSCSLLLWAGLVFKRPLIRMLFEELFQLTDEGWRQLTIRWALFFAILAVLNEIVWRSVSTDSWVAFKVWGVLPLTFAFAVMQTKLVSRYQLPDQGPGKSESVRPSSE